MTKQNESIIISEPTVLVINTKDGVQQYLSQDKDGMLSTKSCWADVLAQNSDADPRAFQFAASLNLPLIDISDLNPEPSALSLLAAQDVRCIRGESSLRWKILITKTV